MTSSISTAVPSSREQPDDRDYARRFGNLLRGHRRKQHTALRELSARAGRTFTAAELRGYERGRKALRPDVVERLCSVYGVPFESIMPEHRQVVIDLAQRTLRIGDTTIDLPASDEPGPHLERYVRMVNKLRTRPMRSPATLRRDDTEALAEAYELDVDEVESLLSDLIGRDAASRRRILTLRSGTGTLAAVIVIGTAVTVVSPRSSEGAQADVTAVLATEVIADDGESDDGQLDDEEFDAAADAPRTIPSSDRVAGPDLVPDAYHRPASASDEAAGSPEVGDAPEEAAQSEDETNIDAPGGPVTIEREDHDAEQSDAPAAEDETNIDAPGGPVTIEREDHDAEQSDTAEDGSDDEATKQQEEQDASLEEDGN